MGRTWRALEKDCIDSQGTFSFDLDTIIIRSVNLVQTKICAVKRNTTGLLLNPEDLVYVDNLFFVNNTNDMQQSE